MGMPHPNEIKRLLVKHAIVRSVCELNGLVFLHRHPRILLTSEQLAEFVGYPLKHIAKTREIFIDARFLERFRRLHNGRNSLEQLAGSPAFVQVTAFPILRVIGRYMRTIMFSPSRTAVIDEEVKQ